MWIRAFAALTVVLMFLGSGLGLTMMSPWGNRGAGVTTFAVSAAIWMIVVQWLSSALGGYMTGRLRARWVGVHTDETFFRDTAHGLLAWALATLIVVCMATSSLTSAVGTGVQEASSVASGAAMGASAGTALGTTESSGNNGMSYFVDSLFRPDDPLRLADLGAEGDATAAAQVNEAKTKAQEAADAARKAGIAFALMAALSLVIGAFIASAAAALGGRLRDE